VKRIAWLDVARALAVIFVVFTHAHEQAGVQSILLKSIYYSVDRIGVPIFLMISGGLILPKLQQNGDILSFYKKRIPQFIAVIIVYSLLTSMPRLYALGGLDSKSVITIIIENNGIYPFKSAIPHLWYMYFIIALYLISPFLSKMVSLCTDKQIYLFITICILLNQFPATMAAFGYKIEFLQAMGNNFTGAFLVYYLLGYMIIHKGGLSSLSISSVIGYSGLTIIPIGLLAWYEVLNNKLIGTMHWYSGSLSILISSVGLLMLIKVLFSRTENSSWVVNRLSLYSFGIYLSHYAFIYLTKAIAAKKNLAIDDVKMTIIYCVVGIWGGYLLTSILIRFKTTKWLVS